MKEVKAVQSPKTFTEGDRCKFLGEITPALFSYNTRVEGGGIFIGFNKVGRLTKRHLSADDIHKALLPRTIEVGSEVMIEGIIYIVKEYIVVDERKDKTISFNEEFTPDKCEYDLQHPESNECKHFLANSPSVAEVLASSPPMTESTGWLLPPLQQLVGLTGVHEYHYYIKSKEKPIELLIGLDQKPQDMIDGGEFEM